jgi:inner membrane protein
MPLPIGHSLMGYAIHDTTSEDKGFSWKSILLFVFVANLPDLDFIPGLLAGEANLYHRHFLSHSLGAALAFGVLAGAYCYFVRKKNFATNFALFSLVYFSHVFLDYFSMDHSAPHGVPMFWPLTTEYFASPFPVFMSVVKGNDSGRFFQSLFVAHNFQVALWEIVVFIPVITIMKLVKVLPRFFRRPLRETEG